MTTFLLIRHAMCDPVGKSLAGRTPGIHLNDVGRGQAERLATRLAGTRLDAVFTSPRERAVETAEPLARTHGLRPCVVDALDDIDFGRWTGRTLRDLDGDAEWIQFNTLRSVVRAPGGEQMLEVQARSLAALETMRRAHPDGRCAVVSHADVIRGTLAHFVGIHLDLMYRLEIAPASISVVRITESAVAIHGVNILSDEPGW
jgi:probable phosphomutase (TIGR03848 family)